MKQSEVLLPNIVRNVILKRCEVKNDFQQDAYFLKNLLIYLQYQ